MFNSGLKEGTSSDNLRDTANDQGIRIPNIPSDIFLLVLVYLYGGDVQFTPDNCIPILQVADQLCLDTLKMVAEIYIGNHIELTDEILEIAEMYCAPRLESLCKIRHLFSIDDTEEKKSDSLEEDEAAFLWV